MDKKQVQLNSDANSNAEIYVQKEKNRVFVYKVETENFSRFERNAMKQKKFVSGKKFRPVAVEILYWKNALAQKQPFISGLTGANLIERSTTKDRLILIECLRELIEFMQRNSKESSIKGKLLLKKTDEVLGNIHQNKFIKKSTIELGDKLSLLIKSKIEGEYTFPKGLYHGDLTLSNIILDADNKDILLFDFLDSYISSYLLDIAKLKQDLIWGWSVRKSNKQQKLKAKIFGESIWRDLNLNQIVLKYKLFDIMDMLNVLRIVPYCKEAETETWVQNVLKEISDG